MTETLENGHYRYYQFYNKRSAGDLLIDVTPFYGDPDMYVSCHLSKTDTHQGFPSLVSTHHNFSSTMMYEDSLVIEPSNPKRCDSGTYYIAIYAFPSETGTHTKYTISVVHSGGTISLTDGEPHDSVVFKNMNDMYIFRIGSESKQVKVTLSPHYGDPDLYLKINEDASYLVHNPASRLDYQYSSYSDQFHDDAVVIPEEIACPNCLLSISVYGYTGSGYTIRATTEDVTTTLQVSSMILMPGIVIDIIN